MELEIVGKRENPLLKRTEVRFRVSHPAEASPQRAVLRDQLAKALHATRDIVVVDFARSEFGRSTSRGYAKVYKSKEDALKVERKHILVRNGLLAAEVKVEKVRAAKPPPPKREAKPEEKAPAPAKEEKPAAREEKKPEGKGPPEKKEGKPAPEKKEAEKKEEKKPEGKKGGKEAK